MSRKISLALVTVLALRFVFHAFYLPVFEGPDEPFHLARMVSFVDGSIAEGWRGETVSPVIVSSVESHPCCNDLARAFGCPPFGEEPAEFNILDFDTTDQSSAVVANYEKHQPPIYYVLGAVVLSGSSALFPSSISEAPSLRLLIARLFSLTLVLIALIGPIRSLASHYGNNWYAALLLVLFVPGASESLVRCANDSAVFLWAALLMWALVRKAESRIFIALAMIGPLIKLTTLPIVGIAVVWAWFNRPRWHAMMIAIASSLIVPLQWFRGFRWGGTVELNYSSQAVAEPLQNQVLGFVRSSYTFLKTTVWLGEWSFFRAPVWVLIAASLFLVIVILSLRFQKPTGSLAPHVTGVVLAIAATSYWFISHRAFWGQWGGVGGWYAWGWYPWVAVLAGDLFSIDRSRRFLIIGGGAILLFIINIAWFVFAHRLYSY
jgi:hypothetical protein